MQEEDLYDVPTATVRIEGGVDPEFQYDWEAEDTENDAQIALELQRELLEQAAPVVARTQSAIERHHEMLQKKTYTGAQFGLEESVRPVFIYSMMISCTFMMLIEMLVNNKREGEYFEDPAINPLFGPSIDTLLFMGAKRADLITEEGDWWRLFMPIFLHGGLLHLMFNLLFLYSFGVGLESDFGHSRVAYIYIVSGFFGILCSAILNPTLVSVGASGACYGLIGAAWAEFGLNFHFYKQNNWKSWLCQLSFGTLINLALGLIPTLDNFAHIGGLLAGFFTGLTVLTLPRYDFLLEEKPDHCYQILLRACGVFMTPLILIIFIIILYVGVDANQYCPWCHYLTCVKTEFWLCEITCDEGFAIDIKLDGSATITCPRDIGLVSVPEEFVPDLVGDDKAQFAFCNEHCLGR